MKKVFLVWMVLIFPLYIMAQDNAKNNTSDNVKIDKKDNKKSNAKAADIINNPKIRKSKKDMDKQSAKMDKPKYHGRMKHVKPKEGDNKDDKADKKEQKKEL